jgi:hypothetical protein
VAERLRRLSREQENGGSTPPGPTTSAKKTPLQVSRHAGASEREQPNQSQTATDPADAFRKKIPHPCNLATTRISRRQLESGSKNSQPNLSGCGLTAKAPVLGTGEWGFDSPRPDHLRKKDTTPSFEARRLSKPALVNLKSTTHGIHKIQTTISRRGIY